MGIRIPYFQAFTRDAMRRMALPIPIKEGRHMALRFVATDLYLTDAFLRLTQRMACGALLALGLGWVALPASAAVKCVDAKGKTVYQDMPCEAGARVTPIQGQRSPQEGEVKRPPTVAELKEQADALLEQREAVLKKINACELRREAEVRRQIMRHDAGDARTADDKKRLYGILAECQVLVQQQAVLIKKSVAGSRGPAAGGADQASNPTEASLVQMAPCLREIGEELSRQYALKTGAAGDMRSSADHRRLVEMQNTCDVNGGGAAAATGATTGAAAGATTGAATAATTGAATGSVTTPAAPALGHKAAPSSSGPR